MSWIKQAKISLTNLARIKGKKDYLASRPLDDTVSLSNIYSKVNLLRVQQLLELSKHSPILTTMQNREIEEKEENTIFCSFWFSFLYSTL